MSELRFAVLTAAHEGTYDYLPFCIESVRAQAEHERGNYTFQHVIVSDGSERTRDYINAEASRDPHIVTDYLEENQGQVPALKAGELALIRTLQKMSDDSGTPLSKLYPHLFLVVDGDDGIPPNTLLNYTKAVSKRWEENQTIPGMMFGPAAIIDEHNQPLEDVPHIRGYNNIPDTTDPDSFLRKMKQCNHLPSKPAIRWEFFSIGAIPNTVNDERVTCADWLLALRGLDRSRTSQSIIRGYVHMPEATSYYRVRPGQMSVEDVDSGAWERERSALVEGPFDPFSPKGLTLEDCRALGWAPSRTILRQMMLAAA